MRSIQFVRALCASNLLVAALCAQPSPLAPIPGYSEAVIYNDASSSFGLPGFAFGITEDDLFLPNRNIVRRGDPALDSFTDFHVLPTGHDVGLITSPHHSFAVYFSDFQAGTLFRFDLLSEMLSSRPLPSNGFDLDRDPVTGSILVSANPDFPLPGAASGVWLVDPNGGSAHRELVRLSGPSGPLAFEPGSGDLLVAEIPSVIPPAPGTVRLLRFTAAQLQAQISSGGAPLGATDAMDSIGQLDGAYDMAFDNGGHLYISDVNHHRIYRTLAGATALAAAPFCGPGTDAVSSLAFRDFGATPFDAFQPASGNALFALGVASSHGTAVHAIRAARPTLASTPGPDVPAGPFTIAFDGAPLNSAAWILFGFGPPLPFETLLSFGHSRLLRFGLDPVAPILVAPVATDATGAVCLPLMHAAGSYSLTLQALAFDAGPGVQIPALVSSAPIQIRLTP